MALTNSRVDLSTDLPLTHPHLSGCRMALEELGWETKMWSAEVPELPGVQWTLEAHPSQGEVLTHTVILSHGALSQDYGAAQTVARLVRTGWTTVLRAAARAMDAP